MSDILYIAQFFSTESEPGGQGQRHYKHARSLAEDGHHVTVITSGSTTMAMGEPSEPADVETAHNKADREALWHNPRLEIIKLPSAPMANRSVLSRAVRYFSFSARALWTGLTLIYGQRRDYNFVLGSSPPLLMGLVAWVLAFLCKAEFILEVRDLWSQTMAANGFIKNPVALWLNKAVESFLYAQSKQIIVVSKAFEDEIEKQVSGSLPKCVFIPNGADLEYYEPPKLWRGSFLHGADRAANPELFNVIFAGVFSDYTNLETLLDAAAILKEQAPHVRIHLAGGGYQFTRIRELVQEKTLHNIKFWGTIPKSRISKFLMEGDLSIINYRNLEIFGQVLPNKLFDYLAAGKPILAATPSGEVSRILTESGAGKCVIPEDPQALANSIVWFSQNRQAGLEMGKAGHAYVRRNFNREVLVQQLLELFPRVIPIDPAKRVEHEAVGQSHNILPFPKQQGK